MNTIRPYTGADFRMIEAWWRSAGDYGLLPSMMPTESTFVLEMDGIPALSMCVIKTNIKEWAYLENIVGNPVLKGQKRRTALKELYDHCAEYARCQGYKKLLCMTYRPKLVPRYQAIGMKITMTGLISFVGVL